MKFTQFLRVAWIGATDEGEQISATLAGKHLTALSSVAGVGRTGVYRLVPLDALHQQLRNNLRLIEAEQSLPQPQLLVFSEFESMRAAVDAEDEIRALPLERGDDAAMVVGRAVLLEVASAPGIHASEFDDFAPAVQVGLFNMDSAETERDLSYWYEYYRFVPFKSLEGGVRARRFLTVWGPAKFCVIYEFNSRQAHSQNFIAEPELRAHDKSHVTGKVIPHTIHHELLSQSVGVKLPLA
jgi:hypothetical protein